MLLQAILLGLVAMLGNAEYLFGTSLLSRPLVMGTLTGIVLGDIQTGVTLGATLELAFMGAFSIGASIPPEMISGTVLGTAFTITTGAGPETALTVGLPVASLVLIAKNVGMVFILPPFVHKADKYAAEGNMAGVARMHLLGGFFGVNLIIGVIVACGYYAGGPAVQALLNVIPTWIHKSLLSVHMDFKWFTNHNGLITCNWVRFIINDDYGKRRCMFLLLRICIKRILKDSSNSNRNLWSYHCYRINSVT